MKQEGQIQPMIQDILPKHLKNEYIPKQPAADSLVLGFHDRTVYLKEQDGEITFLTYGEWKNYCREKKGMEEPICADRRVHGDRGDSGGDGAAGSHGGSRTSCEKYPIL